MPAEAGKRDAPTSAFEQRAVQFEFEPLDRGRERGLADAADLRGARKASMPADRKEVADLLQLHGAPESGPASEADDGPIGPGRGGEHQRNDQPAHR